MYAALILAVEGVKPKVEANAFEDLLGSQGFVGPKPPGPTTLGGLKREEDIKDLTGEEIKVLRTCPRVGLGLGLGLKTEGGHKKSLSCK